MKQNETIKPATENEREEIRNENEHLKITSKARSGQQKKIHILDKSNEKFCKTNVDSLTKKEFSVIPPGYYNYCKECLQRWRDKE
jgi:hypothetical protein